MPTRKELIDRVRADQRARSARTRADNPKSAIVGIGDRDPLTGQYQVLLPDGSVEMGEKQFNSSLPNGSQVLGIPQLTGGWLLDDRDVQPINPTIQPSPMGKIKILYSQIEGNERVFYLWGDRPKPKQIGSIPSLVGQVSQEVSAAEWTINNRGSGDRFIASILWENGSTGQKYINVFGDHQWSYTLPAEVESALFENLPRYFYLGQGFYSIVTYNYFSHPDATKEQSSYSLYKGARTNYAATSSGTYNVNFPHPFETLTHNIDVAISPKLTRHSYSLGIAWLNLGLAGSDIYFLPQALDQDGVSCVYRKATQFPGIPYLEETYSLNKSGGEVKLGGALPLFFAGNGTLVNKKFYQVNPGSLSDREWNVDVYKLGSNTTKTTIKSKFTYKHKVGMEFHDASYHP